ncbi:hypothetical protein AB1Y20_007504 [Prymnesium parvum]|uniref:Uncharacterized protein n=1 Tax=Prymnesium parvum TaxID=97485 RepID=A0AB34IX79_PRYPA
MPAGCTITLFGISLIVVLLKLNLHTPSLTQPPVAPCQVFARTEVHTLIELLTYAGSRNRCRTASEKASGLVPLQEDDTFSQLTLVCLKRRGSFRRYVFGSVVKPLNVEQTTLSSNRRLSELSSSNQSCNTYLPSGQHYLGEDAGLFLSGLSYPLQVSAGETFTVSGYVSGHCNRGCAECSKQVYLGFETSSGCPGMLGGTCCGSTYYYLLRSHSGSACDLQPFSVTFTAPSGLGCYPLLFDEGWDNSSAGCNFRSPEDQVAAGYYWTSVKVTAAPCNTYLPSGQHYLGEDAGLFLSGLSYPLQVSAGETFTVSGYVSGHCNRGCAECSKQVYLGFETSSGCPGMLGGTCCGSTYYYLLRSHSGSACDLQPFSVTFTAPSGLGCYPLLFDEGWDNSSAGCNFRSPEDQVAAGYYWTSVQVTAAPCNTYLPSEQHYLGEDEGLSLSGLSYPLQVSAGETFTVSGYVSGHCNRGCAECSKQVYLGFETSSGCPGMLGGTCCGSTYYYLLRSHSGSACDLQPFSVTFTAPRGLGCYPLLFDEGWDNSSAGCNFRSPEDQVAAGYYWTNIEVVSFSLIEILPEIHFDETTDRAVTLVTATINTAKFAGPGSARSTFFTSATS